MKDNYSLFYDYRHNGDVLIVIFNNDKSPTRNERKKDVEVIYHQDEVIGYNIFNIRNVVKIKSEGLIYLPSPTLINVINNILKNSGVEELAPIKESGYIIGEVKRMDGNIAINIGKEEVIIPLNNEVQSGDKVVIAKVGTRLNNSAKVQQFAHLCTEQDLQISEEDKVLILDKDEEIGKDFFTTEVK